MWKNISSSSDSNKTYVFLDTNILINVIKEKWHLESLMHGITTETYKFVVPKFILEELKHVKEKRTIKNGAVRFAEELTELLDDEEFLQPEDYEQPIDDLLLTLALMVPFKKYIMTQDLALKDKILQAGLSVILITYGKAKLLRPEN